MLQVCWSSQWLCEIHGNFFFVLLTQLKVADLFFFSFLQGKMCASEQIEREVLKVKGLRD